MIYLLEAIWYAICILFKVCWLPIVIMLIVALIAWFVGSTNRAIKKDKESKEKKK